MSEIQSVVFKATRYDTTKARKWLSDHGFKPIKRVDKAANTLRYRIRDPKKYKSFITKKLNGKGILLVIGFKSTKAKK
jgi:hypothetical protein